MKYLTIWQHQFVAMLVLRGKIPRTLFHMEQSCCVMSIMEGNNNELAAKKMATGCADDYTHDASVGRRRTGLYHENDVA